MSDDLLTMRDVCRFFGGSNKPVDRSTIYRWIQQGKLAPSIHMTSKTQRWRLSDCQRALDVMAGKEAA